ncbi:MAG TPA: hypothetical protein QF646_01690 [Candidatus Poseidoniales archaeon]|nr:hypothetical protein [Candidatus Poseidoniales archaeon]
MLICELPAFASISFDPVIDLLRRRPVLEAPATAMGGLSMSILESGMLDAGLAYHRRWTSHSLSEDNAPTLSAPRVIIEEVDAVTGLHCQEMNCTIGAIQAEILHSEAGYPHLGRVDPLVTCAAISEFLAPHGARTRRMLRYCLAGPWLRADRLRWVDPLHSMLRDAMERSGLLVVKPDPAWPRTLAAGLPISVHDAVRNESAGWGVMSDTERTSVMSVIAARALTTTDVPTPRLEVLIWQRPGLCDAETDVFSEIEDWLDGFDTSAIDDLVDGLLRRAGQH